MTVALYVRCSTTEQHPDAHLGPLRAWAAAHGQGAVEYVDEGVSGAKARRPALDAMMRAVRAGEVQAVAVAALDRLGRDVANLLAIAGELHERKVELVSLREGLDLASPVGKALFTMLGLVAELERAWIRERVRHGIAAARRRGTHIGRRPASTPMRAPGRAACTRPARRSRTSPRRSAARGRACSGRSGSCDEARPCRTCSIGSSLLKLSALPARKPTERRFGPRSRRASRRSAPTTACSQRSDPRSIEKYAKLEPATIASALRRLREKKGK